MMARLSCVVAAVAALAAWPGAQSQTPQTFRTGTDVVVVDVSVKRDNVPVTGLTAADFELRDNGVRQEIESVETAAVPIDLSIVVDVSGNPARPWTEPQSRTSVSAKIDAEVRKLTKLLRSGDRVRLFAVDTYIQQLWPLQPAETAPAVRDVVFDGQSSLYDTLATVILQPVEPTRRHVVVASTKGFDSISALSATGFRTIAGRADAQVHLVMRETDADNEEAARAHSCILASLCSPTYRFWLPARRRLFPACGGGACVRTLMPDGFELKLGAESTGGGLYQAHAVTEPTLFSTFAAAFDNFRQSYVLRYTARNVRREGWHQIVVTVPKDPSVRISARTGYAVDIPPSAPPPPPPPRPAATVANELRVVNDFTTAYARGDFDAVNIALRRVPDSARFINDFDRAGNPWPGNPRREALFALEVAEAGMFSVREDARDAAAQLLQRFSWLVRDPIEPAPFERSWLVAAVTMLQGTMRPGTASAFINRALERFPDEPRFILARAIVLEQNWPQSGAIGVRATATAEHIAAVTSAYEAAAAMPAIRVEALVRWGWFLHRIGKKDEGLAKLTEAATAGKADQALTYLRELLTARALLANGRAAEAVEAFKRAAAIAPGASSARVGLVSALVILGERAEAEQLTEALQTGKATVVDPWWIYWQGDYRRYPETLRSMRELVR